MHRLDQGTLIAGGLPAVTLAGSCLADGPADSTL